MSVRGAGEGGCVSRSPHRTPKNRTPKKINHYTIDNYSTQCMLICMYLVGVA